MKSSEFTRYLLSIAVILVCIICLIIGFQVILWAIKFILIGALIAVGAIMTWRFLHKKPKDKGNG
jgi:hypothetical protein